MLSFQIGAEHSFYNSIVTPQFFKRFSSEKKKKMQKHEILSLQAQWLIGTRKVQG